MRSPDLLSTEEAVIWSKPRRLDAGPVQPGGRVRKGVRSATTWWRGRVGTRFDGVGRGLLAVLPPDQIPDEAADQHRGRDETAEGGDVPRPESAHDAALYRRRAIPLGIGEASGDRREPAGQHPGSSGVRACGRPLQQGSCAASPAGMRGWSRRVASPADSAAGPGGAGPGGTGRDADGPGLAARPIRVARQVDAATGSVSSARERDRWWRRRARTRRAVTSRPEALRSAAGPGCRPCSAWPWPGPQPAPRPR